MGRDAGTCYAVNFLLAFADASAQWDPPTRWVASQSGEERQDRAKIARSFGVEFDTRSRLEILTDLKRQGFDAWPSVSPRFLFQRWWEHYWGAFPFLDPEPVIRLKGCRVSL
jgi:hypothetical protein